MRINAATRRMGLATLAGGLAFVGTAEAVELVIDGSFENTHSTSSTSVNTGGKVNPGINGGWSVFSTYLYTTGYTLPLTNGLGVAIGGLQYLRPYPSGLYGISGSSQTVTQQMSLTATTTLTPQKIDSGSGSFKLSGWFCTYRSDNDFSDLTLQFLDASTNAIGVPFAIGGSNFVAALPSGNGRYTDSRFWGQDSTSGAIPTGARSAQILIQSTALAGAGPDGYVDLVSLDVVDATLTTPVLVSADPANNAVSVGPVVNITVGLQDRATAVDTNSIRLFLDNIPVSAAIQKIGTNTTVTYAAGLLPSLSVHTYAIAFSDNGSPAATSTNQFQFTVANYLTLPASLAAPLGSEDTTKPGFDLTVFQVDTLTDPSAGSKNIPDSIEFDEALLAGYVGTNDAYLVGSADGNRFEITNVVHWANSTGNTPNFPSPDVFPGIPGNSLSEDNFVDEIRTFVRFPTAGYYQMGINNNDDLRLTAATQGVQALRILAPTNTVIPGVPIATNITKLLFGGALPFSPLTAPVVYATPSGNSDDSCFLATNTALAGKIALLDRGTTNCTSDVQAYQAQLAGAVAVLETTPGDTGFPFRLSDDNPAVTIPVIVITENYGGSLLKSYLTNGVAVTASIVGDASPRIAEWNADKQFGNVDVRVGFAVPVAGVYPMRLVAGHANGGADLEWFSIGPDGTAILINDTTNPKALLTFRAITVIRLNPPVASGGKVTLSWTGTGILEEATSVNGPWSTSLVQDNPQTAPPTGQAKFYRIHHSQ